VKKLRLTSLAITGLIVLFAATALLWVGCSENPISGNMSAQTGPELTKFSPENADHLAQVIGIQNKHTQALVDIDGVIGTGTTINGDGHLAVMVFTEHPGVQGIPLAVDGVPVVIEYSGKFEALKLTDRYRPAPIGVSVGNNLECVAGTIGCQLWIDGQKYLLSNNHVLARENDASLGEDIVQPGRYDNTPLCANNVATDKIGELADFEPLTFDGSDNILDAAIALYTTDDVTCATLPGYYGFPSTTTVDAYVGQPIMKVGRTTEFTTGTITAINVSTWCGYSAGNVWFVQSLYTSTKFTKAGDSGSLVVTNDGNKNPVGLLYGGSRPGNALLCPIDLVLERFNATICGN